MALSAKSLIHWMITNPSIIALIITCCPPLYVSAADPLDSEPNELGLNGDLTPSAKYGWKVLLNDMTKSWTATKLYQTTAGKGHQVFKKFLKPVKSVEQKSVYSPKRSSKCLFGTPDPQTNCGADIVASIATNEYQKLAQRLWRNYLLRNSLNHYIY